MSNQGCESFTPFGEGLLRVFRTAENSMISWCQISSFIGTCMHRDFHDNQNPVDPLQINLGL